MQTNPIFTNLNFCDVTLPLSISPSLKHLRGTNKTKSESPKQNFEIKVRIAK